MITDSCNCFGRTGHGCKGPDQTSQSTCYKFCDRSRVRRRCQSEGLYQEGDPLKELNWCCDRGCVLPNRSQKNSQVKKTDLETNEKKINFPDDPDMDGDASYCCHNKKHPSKLHNGKHEIDSHFHNYCSDLNSEQELNKYTRTQNHSELGLEKCNLFPSYHEKSNFYLVGDGHDCVTPVGKSLGVAEKEKTSSEMREKYIAEMEILRNKLSLLKDDMVGDGKRLRQRSESEPGFTELSGGVPKRARDNSPKIKLGCRKLPMNPTNCQSLRRHPLTLNTFLQRKTTRLSPSPVKISEKVEFQKTSFSKISINNLKEVQELTVNESDEDHEEAACEGEPQNKECPDTAFSDDDDGSVQSILTSASSDSNTTSKVGETLSSITLNETHKELDLIDPDSSFESVPTSEQVSQNCCLENESLFRTSLFPNVPPYVKFFMHDFKGPTLPVDITKHLKWKLSSITPIVIRRTLINSGFKLVRRNFEQYYHLIYIAPHRKEGIKPPFPQCSRVSRKHPKESNEWTGQWGKQMKAYLFKTLKDFQKLNHFPGTFQIGRKDRLWKNLCRLMLKFGKKEFGFIPKTYILPHDRKMLKAAWERSSRTGKGQWIVKPPAAARGTGIKVIHKWGQIPKKEPLIVQRYIAQPYLINGSKFDLRLYVLMTSIHPLRIYLYDDGLVRFASVKYSDDVECLGNRFMHLTNYSINKLSTQYQVNADASSCNGHKWSLKSLWTYLAKEGVNVKALKKNLTDLVIKTIISGESSINVFSKNNLPSRYCSYELFGIDVLLDRSLKPWLLEVNISPSLHSASPLDLAVKGPLVKELLNVAGFQIPAKLTKEQEEGFLESCGFKERTHTMCYDKRLYWTTLSKEEKAKQKNYQNMSRKEYLSTILEDLTPDDVRHLIQFEDELTQIKRFEKIFPTCRTHTYHQFFQSPRYYNMMLDAWETKYQNNRAEGIRLLASLCEQNHHLNVPFPGGKAKSSPNPNDPNSQPEGEAESEPQGGTGTEENVKDIPPSSPERPSPKEKTPPPKPSVVPSSPGEKQKTSVSLPSTDSSELNIPLKESCMKMLADIRQNGLKFSSSDAKPEQLKQYPSCKLENSIMRDGLSRGKSVLSPTKHIHNACIKMSTSS